MFFWLLQYLFNPCVPSVIQLWLEIVQFIRVQTFLAHLQDKFRGSLILISLVSGCSCWFMLVGKRRPQFHCTRNSSKRLFFMKHFDQNKSILYLIACPVVPATRWIIPRPWWHRLRFGRLRFLLKWCFVIWKTQKKYVHLQIRSPVT